MTVNDPELRSIVKTDILQLFDMKHLGVIYTDRELIQQIRNKCDYFELMIDLKSKKENKNGKNK